MKHTIPVKKFVAIALLAGAGNLWALDTAEQQQVDMITAGSMSSIKQAAQEIFNSGEKNPAVLDYLAEVLLQHYATATPGEIDTLSWTAKALGQSGNSRYHDALSEVANNEGTNKKLRKYADKALDDVGKASGAQYKRGTVSLKAGAAASSGKSTNQSTNQSTKESSASGGTGSLAGVTKGMSMAEAYKIAGEPTTTTSHVTGKAWIPFNFRGADTARQFALYKGKGRIIFTNSSYYDHSWHVYEVQVDANESGYP